MNHIISLTHLKYRHTNVPSNARTQVRAQAIGVYRLSNDVSFYRRCRHVEKEKKKDNTSRVRVKSSTTFTKLHKSLRPSILRETPKMKRPESMLLNLDSSRSLLGEDESFWADITTISNSNVEEKKKDDNVTLDLMDIFGDKDSEISIDNDKKVRVEEEEDPFDAAFFNQEEEEEEEEEDPFDAEFFNQEEEEEEEEEEDNDHDDDAFSNFDDEWDLPPVAT